MHVVEGYSDYVWTRGLQPNGCKAQLEAHAAAHLARFCAAPVLCEIVGGHLTMAACFQLL
jgi:hypothetical protein